MYQTKQYCPKNTPLLNTIHQPFDRCHLNDCYQNYNVTNDDNGVFFVLPAEISVMECICLLCFRLLQNDNFHSPLPVCNSFLNVSDIFILQFQVVLNLRTFILPF